MHENHDGPFDAAEVLEQISVAYMLLGEDEFFTEGSIAEGRIAHVSRRYPESKFVWNRDEEGQWWGGDETPAEVTAEVIKDRNRRTMEELGSRSKFALRPNSE